ncbi:MAG: response regulator [Rhodoferax sp.]|uniref:response regulator n=1 Tax=Rhodoferax sp. TaxID=50421 RepID=UPI002637C895|nr:response regulator [Rhodoferax sp.]MDD5335625.1 response regulator [Rhodoferax sp.]
MTEELKNLPYLTPNEVAQWMMVSPVTVRSWAQKGLLQAEVTPGGHRRFRREEVERFARQWNPQGNKGPLRVLIVDDDRAIVGFLRELLEGGDYQTVVETAHDGFEAGRKVHAFAPDIVLLDFMMPGIKGSEVCRQIKQLPGPANVRVIAMSGYLSPENEAELLAAGAECCLSKPLDTNRLLKLMGLED